MDALVNTWISMSKDDTIGESQGIAQQKLLNHFGSTEAIADYVKNSKNKKKAANEMKNNTVENIRADDEAHLHFRDKSDLHIYNQMITPEIAAKLLDSNHNKNRKVNKKVVESYARQMEQGKWQCSGEAIKISAASEMLDGQHRLHGIIRASELRANLIKDNLSEKGKFYGVEMLIISGIPEQAMKVIDDNYRRSISDAFAITGKSVPNQATINSALKCLMTLHGCTLTKKHYSAVQSARRNSTSEVIAFYDALPKFKSITAKFFSTFNTPALRKSLPTGTALALYYLFHDVDENTCFSIFKSLETGIPLDDLRDSSPSYRIYHYVRKEKELKRRIDGSQYISLFLWCFCRTLEHSRSPLPKLLVWNWSDENAAYNGAKKKLRGLNL